MYRRPMGAAFDTPEKFSVCTNCGALVANGMWNAHDKLHKPRERATPNWEGITVSQLKELLENFDDDKKLGIQVSGYEWDSAQFGVIVGDKLFPIVGV